MNLYSVTSLTSFLIIIYANISLFHWVYFASFFDHYIEQNSCSKSVPNELKYACKRVLFLLKLQAIGLQLY